jgi:DNA-binding beta-propeller fold protein YncE
MIRIDPATMTVTNQVGVPCCPPHVGAAVDQAGHVWVVSQGGSRAYRIDSETFAISEFPVGSGPYTYSDMTGYALSAAGTPNN